MIRALDFTLAAVQIASAAYLGSALGDLIRHHDAARRQRDRCKAGDHAWTLFPGLTLLAWRCLHCSAVEILGDLRPSHRCHRPIAPAKPRRAA